MTATSPIASAFATLQQVRAATWSPEALAAGAAQRSALVAAFDPEQAVGVGDAVPDTVLIDLDNHEHRLSGIVAHGPAVLIVFRFATCGADNIALPIYDRALFDALDKLGVRLVAISPQVPDRLREIGDRHKLRLTILSDPDNGLARALGLVFTPLETPAPPPAGWIGEITGTGTWELPLTSILIVDTDRIARFVAISPDWLDRIEPEAVLGAVRALGGATGPARAAA